MAAFIFISMMLKKVLITATTPCHSESYFIIDASTCKIFNESDPSDDNCAF
jgi:hypothetical protein